MTTFLESHMNNIENLLLAFSKVASDSGHPINKGTAREVFVREFLQNHLSENVGFGTGEILDCNSIPKEKRNQIDLVLYKKGYPKLSISTGISGFLVESVIATIEVKSTLTKPNLFKSFDSIRNIRKLEKNITRTESISYQPPDILSVVLAYNGPAKMSKVYDWINEYVDEKEIKYPAMPPSKSDRSKIPSPLADLIIVLGKGFVQFDNSFLSPTDDNRKQNPDFKWISYEGRYLNLLTLFSQLTFYISHSQANFLTISPYLKNVMYELKFLP